MKNIQHAFSLCNVVRVEEHAGGGGGVRVCQIIFANYGLVLRRELN